MAEEIKLPELYSPEEQDKLREFAQLVGKAYWRIWFGKPIFDHIGLREDLTKAKKILTELGI